ncbi:Transmembrane protease serine 2 [Taenia solium]|eukprot:TsM_000507500 transcript=TsM_000507500 gene=TsM_000507500
MRGAFICAGGCISEGRVFFGWACCSSDKTFLEEFLPDKVLHRTRRIINGELADMGKFPFIVSIQAKLSNDIYSRIFGGLEHFCGGTLIAPRWILTAAHCMFAYTDDGKQVSLLNPKAWHVRMATDKLRPSVIDRMKGFFHRAFNTFFGYRKPQTFYHLAKIILHPDYVEGFLENDIALLKLKEHVLVHRMKSLDVLTLPDPHIVGKMWPKTGQNCSAVGWGSACINCPPEMYMKVVNMPIIGPEKCRGMYKVSINLTESNEFCAGYFKRNIGICSGDSGGPLVCDFEGERLLAGVTSAIHAKKPESYPAVFTRVVRFTDWIFETMKKN